MNRHFVEAVKPFVRIKPFRGMIQYVRFFSQAAKFVRQTKNDEFHNFLWYPCLTDNLKSTPVDPTYFYQDTWAASKIFSLKPKSHLDIGSSVKTIGIISQFVETTMVDIRPLELRLRNLNFKKGSILALPFADKSQKSISSLCVIEHIGLGRYGDPLDSRGSEKAVAEISRVAAPGANVLISVPVSPENRVYFNAHRAFTREYILQLFSEFSLIEEKYQYGSKLVNHYDPKKDFGTGLFHFEKKA